MKICKLLDDTIHEYYICSKYRDAEYTSYKNMNLIYLGIGTIYSVNNIKQNFTKLIHFWKLKEYKMTTDKQQLQQQVTDMKDKLAEMEVLLNKSEPTINYWQPNVKEYENYYFINQLGNIKRDCANDNSVKRYRVFQTENEAQKYADYIKAEETLKKAIAEANEGWLPDWHNSNDNKLYVYINRNNLGIEQNNWEKVMPTFMYIRSSPLARQLIKDYEQEFITYLSY